LLSSSRPLPHSERISHFARTADTNSSYERGDATVMCLVMSQPAFDQPTYGGRTYTYTAYPAVVVTYLIIRA
jgi:hypothetical protein